MRRCSHFFFRLLILIKIFMALGCSTSKPVGTVGKVNRVELRDHPYVILVSIDGYRSDYTDLYSPPTLKAFSENGVSSEGLLPVYPSKTFTNHYSIATGLYAENHGIVSNSFYDPSRKERYQLSDPKKVQDGTWYGGEPLWVSAEKQGLLAANYFWPGSEAEIQGIRPSYFFAYDQKTSIEKRINQVNDWLGLPEDIRPHFITLYFSDVDTAGHKFGPRSEEVKTAIFNVDHGISLLLDVVKARKLPIDVVIVSDHGMQEVSQNQVEYLDDYVDLKTAQIEGSGPLVMLYFNNEKRSSKAYDEIKKQGKHIQVFKRNEVPENYHFSKNSRIGDLVVMTEAPYSIGFRNEPLKVHGGNHGYFPDTTPSMRGIFYASGPHIAEKRKLKLFRNIHIYPFILKLLGLNLTAKIDGDPKVLETIYQP